RGQEVVRGAAGAVAEHHGGGRGAVLVNQGGELEIVVVGVGNGAARAVRQARAVAEAVVGIGQGDGAHARGTRIGNRCLVQAAVIEISERVRGVRIAGAGQLAGVIVGVRGGVAAAHPGLAGLPARAVVAVGSLLAVKVGG